MEVNLEDLRGVYFDLSLNYYYMASKKFFFDSDQNISERIADAEYLEDYEGDTFIMPLELVLYSEIGLGDDL